MTPLRYVIWRTSCPGCGTSGVVCIEEAGVDKQLDCPACGKEKLVNLEEGLPQDLEGPNQPLDDPHILARKAVAASVRRIRELERIFRDRHAKSEARGLPGVGAIDLAMACAASMAARVAGENR